MKKGAVAIIMRAGSNEREYVGVSRREDANDWNLPGGKLDEGETIEECVVREVLEETGLHVRVVKHLTTDIVPGGEDGIAFEVFTFICEPLDHTEPLQPREGEGGVAWCTAEKVCSGRFGVGNRRRLDQLQEFMDLLQAFFDEIQAQVCL